MNHIGPEAADAMDSPIAAHPGFKILESIVQDSRIMSLYKGCLAMGSSEPRPCRLPRLKMLALPAWLFLKHWRNGWIIGKKIRATKVAIPCLWGVFKDGGPREIAGVKRFTDDMYLYGEHFRAGDIVHIFGDWDIPEEGKREWREAMDARGIPHADRADFGVNGRLLRLTLWAMWRCLAGIFHGGDSGKYSHEMWRASIKGLYHYILKHYEMENVEYRVEVVKNDYNPGHVAATIAANQAGRKRIGISHVSSSVDSPQLCFVHFDKYATVCPMQEKWHGRFWDGLPIERVGGMSIDSVVGASKRMWDTRIRLDKKYDARLRNVLVLFPGNAERCLVSQWEKMCEGLLGFTRTDIDARIFLRFRRLTEAMEVPHMAMLANLTRLDGRFILEHEEFNTHELMAASGLIITANASFAINEALVLKKPVFTFDYTLKSKQYLGMYDPGFILTEPEDVLHALKNIKYLDANAVEYQEMRRDADYHFDGKNRERLAGVVAKMVWGNKEVLTAAKCNIENYRLLRPEWDEW